MFLVPKKKNGFGPFSYKFFVCIRVGLSTRFSLSMMMSRLTRDGTAEPVSRDQILRHARGQGNVIFPCSADHEQDWQPYPVDPYSAICDDHTYIHRDLLLYLYQKLDENNSSNQQVHTIYSTRWYAVMWHQIMYFLQNLVLPLLLFANKEGGSSERRMEGGIADETSMPPSKSECFGSAA